MRFADPLACPDCQGAITGETSCSHCGLDLTSVEARQLWQTLLQADDLLARARQHRVGAAAPAATPPGTPVPPTPRPSSPTPTPPPADPFAAVGPAARPYPAPPPPPAAAGVPAPAQERSWSVGTILLVLGAFGLVVAGLIFVTRSWGDIGLAGKTVILLAVTAVIGALGAWVTRRTLRASSEAVWTVFLALLTLDFFAARHEDLVGLGSLDVAGGWVVWGVVALGLGLGIAAWARPRVGAALVSMAVASGLAITMAGIGAGATADSLDVAWRALVALVVAGLLALATRPAALAPTTLAARIVVAGFYVFAYAAAVVELVDHPALDDLAGGGHGAPLLLMGITSVVVAAVVPVVRIPAVALAVVAGSALVLTPVADAGGQAGTWTAIAVLATVLAGAGTFGTSTDDWMRGLRVGAVPAIVALVAVEAVLVADVLETVGRVLDDPWRLSAGRHLDVASVDDRAGWVVPVVLVGVLATVWAVAHWPEVGAARRHAVAVAGVALALGTTTSVVALRWPVWAMVATLVVLAAVLVGGRSRRVVAVPTLAALGLVAVASALASASHGVSAATWLGGGLLLLAAAFVSSVDLVGRVHAAAGTALVVAGAAATAALPDVDDAAVALVAVVVALGLMAMAELAPSAEGTVRRRVLPVVEVTAALGLVVALFSWGSSGEIAVRWTVAGVALVALGLVAEHRRWLVWPGIGALVVAYVAVIVGSGFSFVEAYTLPLGAAGLGVGVVLARRRPAASTWTLLGPGLVLALLPSVPQSLADPTGLRALLLGLGAVAVLGIGIRLGWQAPFVTGALVLVLLVLFNIGPYANAAPRVVLIAAVSAVLLGVGITWEDRVRDGRKLAGYVRSMR